MNACVCKGKCSARFFFFSCRPLASPAGWFVTVLKGKYFPSSMSQGKGARIESGWSLSLANVYINNA